VKTRLSRSPGFRFSRYVAVDLWSFCIRCYPQLFLFVAGQMFVGMSICIVLDKTPKSPPGIEATDDEKKSLTTGKHPTTNTWGQVNLIIIPTAFDLLATGCGTTGLLYTTVSVYQMLRGAQLIFTALLSIIFLKKRLDKYNWGGIALSLSGIIIVGGSNVLAESNPTSQQQQVFGVVIIVVGQIMQVTMSAGHILANSRRM